MDPSCLLDISQWNWRMLISIAIVLAALWFSLRGKRYLLQALERSGRYQTVHDRAKLDALNKAATIVIFVLAAFILLGVTNHNLNALIAFGGVGGIAFAFAAQQIISNFFGGMMLYLTQPFRVGDTILLPDRSITGSVEEIGWYMTRVVAPDKQPVYIPNSLFSTQVVITPSRMSHRNIKETFYLSAEELQEGEKKVKKLLHDLRVLLKDDSQLDHTLPAFVHLVGLQTSCYEIQFSAFIDIAKADHFLTIREDLLLEISNLVHKHGLQWQNLMTCHSN
jgi:MscS family membrane protein